MKFLLIARMPTVQFPSREFQFVDDAQTSNVIVVDYSSPDTNLVIKLLVSTHNNHFPTRQ